MSTDLPADSSQTPEPTTDIGRFGMWLFLAALTMLFSAGMLGYILVRTQFLNPDRSPTPALGTLGLPGGLWISTLVILASSFFLHRSLALVRGGRLSEGGRSTAVAMGLAVLFLAIQVPCLWLLAQSHGRMMADNVYLYALMAVLIVIHAAHVVGGMLPLAAVTAGALRGHYTADSHRPLAYMVMYWHFIDVVWVIMFTVFLLLG